MVSILNGLSALGTGVAQFAGAAGLEQQKVDLSQQSAVLADQLATTRESAGRQEAGQIAATAADKQQTFAAGQGQLNRDAEMARAKASEDAAMARTQATINAPPEQIKLLRALGVPLPGNASSAPAASSGDTPPASDGSAAPAGTTAPATPDLTTNPLVAKALGQPVPGSEDAIRRAIADDVNKDPKFKGSTVGQKAAEVESRLAQAQAKIGSPAALDAVAQAIAGYKMSPLDERARMVSGGPEVTARVLALNPSYNSTNYDAIKEAQKAIAPGGSLFTPISAMETSMGHAAHFLNVATQLGNYSGGNWANIIPNKIAANTGNNSLVNALKQTAFAMAEEGNRIYAGNAGTQSAIDNWYKSFPVDGSLADQVGAVKNFAQLMGDKFDSITNSLDKTFKDSGLPPTQLLSDKAKETYQRLATMGPDGKPAAPPAAPVDPAAREIGKSYPLPNGQTGIWRGAGWEVSP